MLKLVYEKLKINSKNEEKKKNYIKIMEFTLFESSFSSVCLSEFPSATAIMIGFMHRLPNSILSMQHSQQLMILMVDVRKHLKNSTRQQPAILHSFSVLKCFALFDGVVLFLEREKVNVLNAIWEQPNEMNTDNTTVCLHSNSKQFLSRNHNNNKEKRQFLVVRFVFITIC